MRSMSTASDHPQKTELGLDELRRRTRGLSQRHRTMLLLVNGKRTRREVLTLAGQAGVGAEFFDELVAMGMVDPLPQPKAAHGEGRSADAVAERVFGASSEWPMTNPGVAASPVAATDRAARGELQVKALPTALPEDRSAVPEAHTPAVAPSAVGTPPLAPELVVAAVPAGSSPAVPPAPMPSVPNAGNAVPKSAAVVHATTASGPPRPRRAAPPVLTLDDAVPLAEIHAPARKAATAAPSKPALPSKVSADKAAPAAAPEPRGARMRFASTVAKPKATARRAAPPVELRQEPRLTPVTPPGRPARIKMLAPAGPLDDENERELLAEVRSLLIGTLLVDGPVTSSLTALRVRRARNRYDLTALVWEIERTLVRAKRPREAQSRLSKARDLLGLGNTVVDEETSPGEHTRPGERTRPQR
jgi:hypothetical protein